MNKRELNKNGIYGINLWLLNEKEMYLINFSVLNKHSVVEHLIEIIEWICNSWMKFLIELKFKLKFLK